MSEILEAALLGIVQGLTEFLPISSTGHLILTEKALGISQEDFGLRFDAAIHLGTLASVLFFFHNTVVDIAIDWLSSLRAAKWDLTAQSRLGWLLITGTVPAGIFGILLEETAEEEFRSASLVGAMLLLFSAPLLAAERFGRRDRGLTTTRAWEALFFGFVQSLALIPGVSRSGITMSAGMLRGLRREDAAVFAFLLSVPIIAAAGGKQIFDVAAGKTESSSLNNEIAAYAVGLVMATLVGYTAIAFLIRFLRINSLAVFVCYRILLGVSVLALAAAGVL